MEKTQLELRKLEECDRISSLHAPLKDKPCVIQEERETLGS
jgi:hypothetical protein